MFLRKLNLTICFIGLCGLFCGQVFAESEIDKKYEKIQQEIENSEKEYEDLRLLLEKTRRNLISKLTVSKDLKSAKEIYEFALAKFKGKELLIFYPMETWYVELLLQDYKKSIDIGRKIELMDELFLYGSAWTHPESNIVYEKLSAYGLKNENQIIADIHQNSYLTNEEKDALVLLLKYENIGVHKQLNELTHISYLRAEELRRLGDSFAKKYPNSPYTDRFVRRTIKNSFWYSLQLGVGNAQLSGNLAKTFGNNLFFGAAAKGGSDEFFGFVEFNVLSKSGLRENFSGSLSLNQGEDVYFHLFDIGLGYRLYQDDEFEIKPYAGIGYSRILQNTDNSNYSTDTVAGPSWGYVLGVGFDWKIQEFYYHHALARHTLFLDIRFREPRFNTSYNIDGSMLNVQLGYKILDDQYYF